MNKLFASLLTGTLLAGLTVNVQAAIPQSYIDQICGEWYWQKQGYMFTVEPHDEDSVQMTVLDLNSTHDHSQDADTEEYHRVYRLFQDASDSRIWNSEDGRVEVSQYLEDDLWIELRDKDERDFYHTDALSFELVPAEPSSMEEYDMLTDDFFGTWISDTTGIAYNFQPLPFSKDIYGAMDYMAATVTLIPDSTEVQFDSHYVMTRHDDKLMYDSYPYDNNEYFYLKSMNTLEYYDENDMVIDTLQKQKVQDTPDTQNTQKP